MPHRNPSKPLLFLFLLTVCGLGWASYELLQPTPKDTPEPPRDPVEALKRQIEEAMASDPCFLSVSSLNWRPNQNHYRVDVQMADGCDKAQAQRLAGRVSELVRRATDGSDAEVWMYSLAH